MNEALKHVGIFHVFDHPGYTVDGVRQWVAEGRDIADIPGIQNYQRVNNILMASQKLAMANAVYPNINSLVITSQTTTPQDNETSYSGTIYTADADQEFTRTTGNPYTVGWNITDDAANGSWGSFILITSGGAMINRALAGVTKTSGTGKLVVFTGTVTS